MHIHSHPRSKNGISVRFILNPWIGTLLPLKGMPPFRDDIDLCPQSINHAKTLSLISSCTVLTNINLYTRGWLVDVRNRDYSCNRQAWRYFDAGETACLFIVVAVLLTSPDHVKRFKNIMDRVEAELDSLIQSVISRS